MSGKNFKKGDKVICVSNQYVSAGLEKGKIYTIVKELWLDEL